MARYTCSYLVNIAPDRLPIVLSDILQACEFEVTYQIADYMMAREIPGKVAFAKLVTVEILIDGTRAKNQEIPVTWVVKNDELPLHLDNHCRQLFGKIQAAIGNNPQWQLVASVAD